MAQAEVTKKEHSSLAAILGWGGLLVFMGLFAWLVIAQLRSAETWADRQAEAVALVRESRPNGKNDDTLGDLLKGYMLKAKDQGAYVGEFAWDAKQKEGPQYEVTLIWKENNKTRVAVWRVDLDDQAIRPQGDEATGLPKRAREGIVGN